MEETQQSNKRARSDDDQPTSAKKKKLSNSFFGEDEDILVSGWFYLDVDGVQQGPFTSKEMKEWFEMGFFSQTTRVKRVTAPEFLPIADSEDFATNVKQKTLDPPPRKPEEADEAGPDTDSDSEPLETSETPQPSLPGPPSEYSHQESGEQPLETDDKVAWQQYQEYQQFQYFMYLQYLQQQQEEERKKQEKEAAKQNQVQGDELQRAQQRMLESHLESEQTEAVDLLERATYLNSHHFDAYGDAPPIEDADPEPQPEFAPVPQGLDPGSYAQQAFFNQTNGRFTAETPEQFWRGKNIPTDREGRMMAHYFDVEAYQRQMREAAANPAKRPKVTKKMIKSYKKKKVDKQRNRILMM